MATTLEDLRNIINGYYNGEDRISTLPDEIIHRIFSFLDAKLAVQTCVLSKRWVNLWTTLPYLNFQLPRDYYYSSSNFIPKFLSNRNKEIPTLILQLNYLDESIAHYEIYNRVKHLHLDGVDIDCYLSFPVLETLRITNAWQTLEHWSLPSLTTLHLQRTATTKYGKPFRFDGFDRLKELTLIECKEFYEKEVVVIKSPNLERLTISVLGVCEFIISTPKLSSFAFCGFIPLLSVEGGFPSLKEADFDFSYWQDKNKELIQRLHCLFSEFGGTKFLTLSDRTISVLMEYSECWPSPFCNLKTVNLLGENRDLPRVINYLLNSSPGVNIFVEEYDGHITNYNPEEDMMLYDSFRYRVVKSKKHSASSVKVDADVLDRVLGVIPRPLLRELSDQSYKGRKNIKFSLWEGHHIYSEDVVLLKYIKEKHPETFEHFAPQTDIMYTLGLITLCTSVRVLSEVSCSTVSTITSCRDLLSDLKRWGFNTTWLVNLLNNVDETSPKHLLIDE